MNEEELEEIEDLDFSELDSFVGDDAWSINFENTGSVEVDIDFFLQLAIMKVGDLVRCPVDLKTGEMYSDECAVAIIIQVFENKPKIEVAYIDHHDGSLVVGAWFIEELELLNEIQNGDNIQMRIGSQNEHKSNNIER